MPTVPESSLRADLALPGVITGKIGNLNSNIKLCGRSTSSNGSNTGTWLQKCPATQQQRFTILDTTDPPLDILTSDLQQVILYT